VRTYYSDTVIPVATCPSSLIVHRDGATAGCTNDDDEDGCQGHDLRHEGDPTSCLDWRLRLQRFTEGVTLS
jgi:hypothetical protein